MPKRIPNLAETILEKSTLLFSTLGYDAVDMKLVAQEAGTSVGNLYNYYKSKPELFLAVVKSWRANLLESSRTLLRSDQPRKDRIMGILRQIYGDVSEWKGLWKEFAAGADGRAHMVEMKARNATSHPWGLKPDELELLAEFEVLLVGQPSPDNVSRWAYVVLMVTIQMAGRFSDCREQNWKFIEDLVDRI